jgi:hypothetical protein
MSVSIACFTVSEVVSGPGVNSSGSRRHIRLDSWRTIEHGDAWRTIALGDVRRTIARVLRRSIATVN